MAPVSNLILMAGVPKCEVLCVCVCCRLCKTDSSLGLLLLFDFVIPEWTLKLARARTQGAINSHIKAGDLGAYCCCCSLLLFSAELLFLRFALMDFDF